MRGRSARAKRRRSRRARSSPVALVVGAPAKINLDLRVLGTRPDGYHELRTVFQSIELHDTLTFTVKKGPFLLKCRHPGVPTDEHNIVWQAADVVWQALGREGAPRDVTVTIEKRIPVEAGLGGGSADGAAALAGLARLWGSQMPLVELRPLAARLGADVGFFLSGGTALGLGRGDDVYPLVDLARHWVVLVLPPFGVSSGEAYAWYEEERSAGHHYTAEPQYMAPPWPSRAAQLINDLEGPIVRRHPEIVVLKNELRACGAVGAAMSGSGSAVFGLFRNRRAAAAALPTFARSGWHAILTRTIDRDEYARRARPRRRRPSS